MYLNVTNQNSLKRRKVPYNSRVFRRYPTSSPLEASVGSAVGCSVEAPVAAEAADQISLVAVLMDEVVLLQLMIAIDAETVFAHTLDSSHEQICTPIECTFLPANCYNTESLHAMADHLPPNTLSPRTPDVGSVPERLGSPS